MKNLLLSVLLVISSIQVFSQGSFQKTYDFGDDYGNNVILGNNGIYVCGSTSKVGAGSYDAFLMNFDTSGNVKWQTQFGGSNFEVGRALTLFPDNSGVLIAGSTASLSTSHKNDIAMSLVDTGGAYMGSLVFGFDSLGEYANDIAVSPLDSGFLITGQTEANGDGNHTDMFVIKTNREGSPLWMKTYGNPTSNEVGLRKFDLPMIGIIAIGSSEAPGVAGQSDAFVAHINEADGTLQDALLIGTSGHDDGRFFIFNNNQIIIAGMVGSMSGPNRSDIFIAALDPSNLSPVWSKVYGGDSATALQSLNVDPIDGHLVVGGYSNSYGTGESGILFKVDSANGNVLWANMIDGPGDDFAQGGTIAPDGTSILCGFSNSGSANNNIYLARTSTTGGLCNNVSAIAMTALDYTYTFSGPSIPGIRDSTVAFPVQQGPLFTPNSYSPVINDLCMGTGVRTLSSKDNTIRVYPNPTSGKLFIESSNGWSSRSTMTVYNMLGSEVLRKAIEPQTKDFTIDLSASPKGMYFISFNDGKTITTEKISIN